MCFVYCMWSDDNLCVVKHAFSPATTSSRSHRVACIFWRRIVVVVVTVVVVVVVCAAGILDWSGAN